MILSAGPLCLVCGQSCQESDNNFSSARRYYPHCHCVALKQPAVLVGADMVDGRFSVLINETRRALCKRPVLCKNRGLAAEEVHELVLRAHPEEGDVTPLASEHLKSTKPLPWADLEKSLGILAKSKDTVELKDDAPLSALRKSIF